jgi:hypothetical protein
MPFKIPLLISTEPVNASIFSQTAVALSLGFISCFFNHSGKLLAFKAKKRKVMQRNQLKIKKVRWPSSSPRDKKLSIKHLKDSLKKNRTFFHLNCGLLNNS